MSPIVIEIIGIAGTLLILFSMLFSTTTIKGDIRMRVLNLIGCFIFTFYGIFVPAISTAILNGVLVVVNTYHLIKLIKAKNKEGK